MDWPLEGRQGDLLPPQLLSPAARIQHYTFFFSLFEQHTIEPTTYNARNRTSENISHENSATIYKEEYSVHKSWGRSFIHLAINLAIIRVGCSISQWHNAIRHLECLIESSKSAAASRHHHGRDGACSRQSLAPQAICDVLPNNGHIVLKHFGIIHLVQCRSRQILMHSSGFIMRQTL